MCQAWGIESHTFSEWSHRVAHNAALLGVPTVIPHWPGTQDSEGDPEGVTFERLVEVTTDAASTAEARCDATTWFPMGMRIGGSVAALAAPALGARRLLLVEPALDPEAFFRDHERSARRASLGAPVPEGWAFSHPIPVALRAADITPRLAHALRSFDGDGAVVRYRRPKRAAVEGLKAITTWGDLRSPPRVDHAPLRLAALKWLRRSFRRDS